MVTYHEIGAHPMELINTQKFNLLYLVPRRDCPRSVHMWSDWYAAIASHHFLVLAVVDVCLKTPAGQKKSPTVDWFSLEVAQTRQRFGLSIKPSLARLRSNSAPDENWGHVCESVLEAAPRTLRPKTRTSNKPWISNNTYCRT